jgi:mannose-6-phosphate isomerase-like protein (cupin superfamily)
MPETLENPVTNQRLTIVQPGADTAGAELVLESHWEEVRDSRPPLHYHPAQHEHFEVLEGRLAVTLGDRDVVLGRGDTIDVPPGVPHEMAPLEPGTRARWEVRPAGSTEEMMRSVWALAEAGRVDKRGMPPLPTVAALARRHSDDFRLASPPWPVQRALFALLAPLARLPRWRIESRFPEPTRVAA